MACCPHITGSGVGAMINIPLTPAIIERFGTVPRVEVFYEIDGNYVAAGVFTQVVNDGVSIKVDNGGTVRYIYKIS